MSNYKAPCKDCPNRTVYCHGRNKDGSWVCEAWGEYQVYNEQRKKGKGRAHGKSRAVWRLCQGAKNKASASGGDG